MYQEPKVIVHYNQSPFVLSYRTSQGRVVGKGSRGPPSPAFTAENLSPGAVCTQGEENSYSSLMEDPGQSLTAYTYSQASWVLCPWLCPLRPIQFPATFPTLPPQINYLHFFKVLCVWYVVYIWFLHAYVCTCTWRLQDIRCPMLSLCILFSKSRVSRWICSWQSASPSSSSLACACWLHSAF